MNSQSLVERVDLASASAAVPPPRTSAPGSRAAPFRIRMRLRISCDADIETAGAQARRLASRLAFAPSDVTVIEAALREVARNALVHGGGGGDVLVYPVRRQGRLGLAIVARDHGPGIANVRQALRDGCSTGGRPGLGLPSARRLMDEFTLRSGPGRGTIVTMRKWVRAVAPASA